MQSQTLRFSTIGIIGGGAWGTALGALAANNGADTLLWAREPDVADAINASHLNQKFLPGVTLPESLRATSQISALAERDAYLFVAPVQFSRPLLVALNMVAADDAPIALCSKGVEQDTGLLMSEVLNEVWPEARPAVLSGPSFAKDVARGKPTAVTLACPDPELGERWVASVGAPHFRPYLSIDVIGAELGGAVKNVLAIAAGAVIGLGYGDSARAALIARGFAEFSRLGVALGAERETMAGLSGLGDLILTAGSEQSRNMSLGLELGRGRALDDVLKERHTVAEGVATASAIAAMGRKAGVDLPVCNAVADLVGGARGLNDIVGELLARPFRREGV